MIVMTMKLTIPENYQAVMPYLILTDAASFITFAEKVFCAKEYMKEMRDETKIMHAEIKIGDSTIMLAEATSEYQPQNAGMFVYVEDADVAIQQALSFGAELLLEASNQPYGRSGGIKDPFGNTWWITSVI